jgi:hypothetical protein
MPSFRIDIMLLREICFKLVFVEISQTKILAFSSLVPATITLRSFDIAMHEISAKVLNGETSSLRNY